MQIKPTMQTILDGHFKQYTISKLAGGASGARLYKISTKASKLNWIIKIRNEGLNYEFENYCWLNGKVKVPEVLFFEEKEGLQIICMSELAGKPLDFYIGKINAAEIIKVYAKALNALHELNINHAPFIQNLDLKLDKALKNIENNLIENSQLEIENQNINLNDLFEKMIRFKPDSFELVFTHGDYCLDNIIFDGKNFTGYIDVGNSGVADRYQDIALAARSILHELGKEWVPLFYKEYGLTNPDHRKVKFYQYLDEFF